MGDHVRQSEGGAGANPSKAETEKKAEVKMELQTEDRAEPEG